MHNRTILVAAVLFCLFWLPPTYAEKPLMQWPEPLQTVLDNTQPLRFPRGKRLPLYLWPAMTPGKLEPEQAETLVRELDKRGVGLVSRWDWNRREQSLAEALIVARAQQKLGLRVNIDATSCLYSFFDGDPRTAHIGADGQPFWDDSFGTENMGCPFTLDFRRPAIRERVGYFADAYRKEGIAPGFVFADWEIDGPLEWNGAWEASQRCARCREHIPHIENFLEFQKVIRALRADLQRDVYAEPLLTRFPKALVGNYAVTPHDGFRYWFDYYEKFVDGQPALTEQKARYRHWANEFEPTGYTFAMPVVYPWDSIYNWYDFTPDDYRWFYNMLREASSAGQYTPRAVPIISFVHWHTVEVSNPRDPAVQQMSEWAYQELLWHMLLRRTDTFFLWCMPQEQAKEVALVHSVWAAAQEYGTFLERGTSVNFEVPKRPGPVISGLLLGDRVLVRRTDFTDSKEPVELKVRGQILLVPPAKGRCQVFTLKRL
ncbi:MAG TPA: hypothetical protein VFB21_06445 [Chthonomonadaceae bacterium]|nr:hypothetical protein [Chthonomonadaceae bacterium]